MSSRESTFGWHQDVHGVWVYYISMLKSIFEARVGKWGMAQAPRLDQLIGNTSLGRRLAHRQ
eukprot:5320454-Amphidinium_carterae.1